MEAAEAFEPWLMPETSRSGIRPSLMNRFIPSFVQSAGVPVSEYMRSEPSFPVAFSFFTSSIIRGLSSVSETDLPDWGS